MISIVRSGPRVVVAEPPEGAFANWLLARGFETPRFEDAFDASDEGSVIFAMVERVGSSITLADIRRIIVIRRQIEEILLEALVDKVPGMGALRLSPRLLVIRGIGDLGAVVGRIEEELGAFPGSFANLLDTESKGCIISVTAKPLSKRVDLADLYPVSLHTPREYREIRGELRRNALRWLNAGSGDRDWADLEVKVYDRYGEYRLQLERIVLVVNALELGLILGESWSTDSPRFMMRIDVYRLRIMSFLAPERVKGIMLGLEYLDDGLRVGDYDLFRHERKVHWSDAEVEGLKDREGLGLHYRREILGLLTPEVRGELFELEKKLRESRRD